MENSKEIDLETALNLRQTIFGQSNFVTGLEWLKSGFKFRKEHNLSFGLDVKKANLKAPMMCVQAYILKHLFFAPQNKGRSHYYNGPEEDHTSIISEDLCGEFHQLLQVVSTRQSNQALVNLLLTGVATPFIHNGKILEGNTHVRSLNGIISRSEFGFLIWCNDNAVVRELGSRLKTPFLPIWITCCNDQYGILFNHNIDLVRDHKAEYFFKLFFYNSSQHVEKLATLTIDSRHNEIMKEDNELVPLQCLISTKWNGAKVVLTNGVPLV
ncbi:Inactive ubiquitin carboxyl-terminal hydrolase MINDY-4B [Nymphon striatum]|nr:Inactive ubiquitin carboxyl-terminal hydrolase MINDY-4B [Nymphon striatum]